MARVFFVVLWGLLVFSGAAFSKSHSNIHSHKNVALKARTYLAPKARQFVAPEARQFKVSPYIFSQGGARLKIAWSYNNDEPAPSEFDSPISAELNDGYSSTPLNIQTDQELYSAELPIGTCGFNSDYSYRVSGMNAAVKISPISCPNEDGPSKFVFLADSQVDTKEGVKPLEDFVQQILKFDAQAVLIGGDLVQTGAEDNLWTQFFRVMSPALSSRALIPGIGNHEYHGNDFVPNWMHYFQVLASQAYYSTYIGETQIIVLNSCFTDDPSLVTAQKLWLETQLMLTHPRWRIVFFHHPPYSVGIANSPFYPKKEFMTLQKEYVPLFEKYKVDLVLNGHVHIFERSERNGVQYLISGPAAGRIGLFGGTNPFSIVAEKARTMVELTVDHNQLVANSVDQDGESVDRIALKK